MAKAPKTHTPAFKRPPETMTELKVTETTVTPVPGTKHAHLELHAQPHGGFAVLGHGATLALASFSTLGEMLAWVGQNMAQPALDAQAK